MNKIFYDPKTLEIKGISDGENSMDLPFLKTDVSSIVFETFKIVLEKNKPVLKVKSSFTEEEWKKIIN